MSGNVSIPNVDFALLSSCLVNALSSLQAVAQDVHTISKTPQAASADTPPSALKIIDNTEKILDENRRLRKENQELKKTLVQSVTDSKAIPVWAHGLFDECQSINEEQVRQSRSCDRKHAQVVKILDEILKSLREMKPEGIAHSEKSDVQEAPLSKFPRSGSTLDASKVQATTAGEAGSSLLGSHDEECKPSSGTPAFSPGFWTPAASTVPSKDSDSEEDGRRVIYPDIKGDTPYRNQQDNEIQTTQNRNVQAIISKPNALTPATLRQWTEARSANRRTSGLGGKEVVNLAFPPGATPPASGPRTLEMIEEMTARRLRALLVAYDQPVKGKSRNRLLVEYKLFIGLPVV